MKLLRIKKQGTVFLAMGLAIGLLSSEAFAVATLKKVQITDGNQVDLLFDSKISENQIKTEFLRDIIQISLNDVSVYPAKIFSVEGEELSKVFAYQYSPKLVRCRLTVKSKAEDYQKRIKVKAQGKIISIQLGAAEKTANAPGSYDDEIPHTAAQANRVIPGSKGDNSPAAKSAVETKNMNAEEKELLEKVMKSSAPQGDSPSEKKSAAKNGKDSAKESARESKEDLPLRGGPLAQGKPLPSPFKSMAMLGVVLAIFLAFAVVMKKFRGGRGQQGLSRLSAKSKGLSSFLSRFTKLAPGNKGPVIEIVANHHLGPKKSIAVVKIAGRTLVLGVTEEQINLITQVAGDSDGSGDGAEGADLSDLDLGLESLGLGGNLDSRIAAAASKPITQSSPEVAVPTREPRLTYGSGAVAAGAPMFSDMLRNEAAKPSTYSSEVRAQIRNRLEGLKQL